MRPVARKVEKTRKRIERYTKAGTQSCSEEGGGGREREGGVYNDNEKNVRERQR